MYVCVSVCEVFFLLLIAPFHPLVHVSVLNRNASLTFSTIYHRRRDIVSYLCQSLFSLLHTPCVCELQATHAHTDTHRIATLYVRTYCVRVEKRKLSIESFRPSGRTSKNPGHSICLKVNTATHTHARARTPHSLCENPSALCLVQV